MAVEILKLCSLALLVMASLNLQGQNVRPFNEDDIYTIYENRKIIETDLYKKSKVSPLFALLPGIGVTSIYNSNTQKFQIFPSISLSLSSFVSAYRQNKTRKNALTRILIENEQERKKTTYLYARKKTALNLRRTEMKKLQEKVNLQKKIYLYDSALHAKGKIKPDSFYKSKIALLTLEKQLVTEKRKYLLAEVELFQLIDLAKFPKIKR